MPVGLPCRGAHGLAAAVLLPAQGRSRSSPARRIPAQALRGAPGALGRTRWGSGSARPTSVPAPSPGFAEGPFPKQAETDTYNSTASRIIHGS